MIDLLLFHFHITEITIVANYEIQIPLDGPLKPSLDWSLDPQWMTNPLARRQKEACFK